MTSGTCMAPHCEAESKAEPIDGYREIFKPGAEINYSSSRRNHWMGGPMPVQDNNLVAVPERAESDRRAGDVVYYDVRSDSVFDMKAPASTELKDLTDLLRLNSSDKEQATTSTLVVLVWIRLPFRDHRQASQCPRLCCGHRCLYRDIIR